MILFPATEAAKRQTEAVSEENQPPAGKRKTSGETAAKRWQERVSKDSDNIASLI